MTNFLSWDDRIDNVMDKLESKYNVDEELLQELRDIRDDIPSNCGECDTMYLEMTKKEIELMMRRRNRVSK